MALAMKLFEPRLKCLPLILFVALLVFANAGKTQNAFAALPPEFEKLQLISGLNEPISFRFLPDGDHILVAQKAGIIRVFHMDGSEDPTPFLTLPVSTTGEQGLLAVEVDPGFAVNGDVFIYYTTPAGFDRLSKFKSLDGGHTADPNTEVVLLQSDAPGDSFHHGGDIRVGASGEVWLTMGDHLTSANGQNLGNMHGKILRINKDGTIPADNPFLNDPTAAGAIWAYGLRNPFRFDLLPSGKPLVADVGQDSWEELNVIDKGANYGWPIQEGPCSSCPYANPVFAYPHTLGYASVTAAMVYSGSTFPAQYQGAVFYGDYALGWIRYLVFDANYESVISDNDFEPNAGTIVDMHQGPDGDLYYATIYPGGFYKIAPSGGNRSPVVQASADPTAGLLPLAVNYSSAGTYDPDEDALSYLWDFGDGATSTQANASHQYTSAPSALAPSDMAGYWKFDEPPGSTSAADSSGNGNNGTLVNMDAQTAWVPGKVGGAISFDGVDDYVSTPFTTQLPNWTIAAWVKSPAAPSAASDSAPIYRGQNFHMHWDHVDPAHQGGIELKVGGIWYPASFGQLQPDTWYHLAGTYDGETLRAYTDGILVSANTTPSGPPDSEITSLKFGANAFNGTVDDVRLYGRVLSASEISSIAGRSVYEATLTVSDGQKATTKSLEITVGAEPPTATIDSPTEGSKYNAGDTISFSGSATDPQDGDLPASAFSWKVILHHLEHIHPYLGPIEGETAGSFSISTADVNESSTWYEIQLRVTDSRGLKYTTSKNIYPNLIQLTVNAGPAGSQFTVNGRPHAAQLGEQAVVGVERVLDAPSPQFVGNVRYKFDHWSDAGQQTHTIVTPSVDTTYTATFVEMPFPPPPWASTDVGNALPGSAEYGGGVFTVTGAGDIWANDNFRYVYQTMNGDGEIFARVTSQTNSNDWAKAGVMIKEAASSGSPYAMMSVTPGNGYAFQHHFNTTISGGPYAFPDAWVKLVRTGASIAAYASADGTVWNQVGTTTVLMATDVTVGLFVASHNPTATSTVTFDNVTVTDYPPPDPPPPPPWATADIGSPTTPGSAEYAGGVFTLKGAGADIWGLTDEFHYVYQPLSGDGQIVTRVSSQTPTDGWAKAGVMIKESATAGSPYALLAVTPSNGYAFQYNFNSHISGGPYAFPNAWVKLTRSGNTIAAYTSTNGVDWNQVGAATVPMATDVTAGLFVNSHNASALGTVQFDNVTVTDFPPPWVATDVGSPLQGSAEYTGGGFTLQGAGADIWGATDEFHYVYQPLSGNGEIVARVTSQTPTDAWAKAGVMIKESATAGSPYALLAVTPSNGYAFQYDFNSHVSGGLFNFPNAWVKLTRGGDTIAAYTSTDGLGWNLVGTATVPMATNVTIGLFATSHNASALGTVQFDNVGVTCLGPVPWLVPAGDDDCDGFTTAVETFMGTNPNLACGTNAWPVDNNDDQKVGLSDILAYISVYLTTAPGPPYNPRYDLNADNTIGLSDILAFMPFYLKTCTP
jgi:glucose/arabinose dehydrogenase/regulation of enolase protein 1 (concanavalin A-like superfamily)